MDTISLKPTCLSGRLKFKISLPVLIGTLLCFSLLSYSCKKKDQKTDEEWLIPQNEVLDGGPGKDGIPSLDAPSFIAASQASYLDDGDLVIGVKVGSEVRAYPHPILDWHEIINDGINSTKFSITYCPLTGSGIWWNRIINGQETTFGVSGLLYNSNLIPYDRKTDSNWSQMKLQSVNGSLINEFIETATIVETTWKTWKAMYPQTKVIDEANTGFNRNYESYPYGDYRTNNNNLIFPISKDDTRLPKKERVGGVIIGGIAKVYKFSSFPDSINVINDVFNSTSLVGVGSNPDNFLVLFNRKLNDGTILTFTSIQNSLPVVMGDNEGNTWDVFGNAISGPRTGQKLKSVSSFIAYWFAWGTFYPGVEIF